MMTKRRIALLIAGMLVGAQVGIASMGGPASGSEQHSEMPLQSDATDPSAAPEQVEPQATEQAAPSEQQPTVDPGYVIPAKPRTLADATFPPLHSDVFPPSTDDRPLHPTVIAYLERKAANTLLANAGAAESPFPESTEPSERILPVQIAYFDALEAQRLAAAEQRMQAEREAASMPAVAAEARPVEAAAQPEVEQIAGNVPQ
ncbi:MAG TPA: hypothetical protein VFP00_11085 [Burkholderiales bacterium]|nr:hypothetical protein [Burkholderiales bacterium]